MPEKEIRHLSAELRKVSAESRRIEGYAAVFETPSKLFYNEWDEILVRGAITEETINGSVVLALMNHEESRGALARSKNGQGSLELTVDERGLKFAFDAPNTPLGDELIESIERGDIDSCSFAFTVAECRWEQNGADRWRRNILKIEQLFDISPVYNPAYESTEIAKRNLLKIKSQHDTKKEELSTTHTDFVALRKQFSIIL